jgi:quercetin dioxygenase-like cupin family protein
MRKAGSFTMCVATTILMILAAPILGGQEKGQQKTQDMLQVCGKSCTVRIDNDQVRVTEVVMKKGDKVGMHFHPCPFLWWTPVIGHLKVTSRDGKSYDLTVKAGEAQWSDADTHAMENTGTTPWRSVVVEMKCPAFAAAVRP